MCPSSVCVVATFFSLIHWFFSLSSFVIPRRCLKNFICAASKRCSSLFFSTQASLPNFNAVLAVIVIEFIIPKFIEGSTCFERHTAHNQELQTVFAASGLYTHVVSGRCPGWVGVPTQPGQQPVTTCVHKPEAANTVWSS